jgi:gas vesicle protein
MATTADTGESTAGQAKDKAQDVAGQAQEKVQQATGQARNQLRDQLDQRSTDAGQRISTQATDLRSVGDQLREQGKDGPAKVADQAAERIERVGGWLSESDADAILGDIEDFGRRNPWAIVAGGVALGFAASRFLKASSSERYQTRSSMSPSRQLPQHASGQQRFSRDITPPATAVPPPATSPAPPAPPTTPGPQL